MRRLGVSSLLAASSSDRWAQTKRCQSSPSAARVPWTSYPRFMRDTQRRHRPSMPAGQAAGVQGVSTPETHTVHGGCGGMSGRPFRPLETMQVGHEGPRLCPGALRYSALLHIIRPRRRDLVRRRQSRQRLTRGLPPAPAQIRPIRDTVCPGGLWNQHDSRGGESRRSLNIHRSQRLTSKSK